MADVNDQDTPECSRRGFCTAALGGAGAAFALSLGYPVVTFLGEAAQLARHRAAEVSEVVLAGAAAAAPGSATMFQLGAEPCVLIHFADGGWAAFSAVCTHLNCIVQYQPDRDRIICPCHEGVFDARTGSNLEGPPPRPLPGYQVSIEGDDVRVSKEAT